MENARPNMYRDKMLLLLTLLFSGLLACSGEDERDLGNPVRENPCEVPVDDLGALRAWLADERYADWPAESGIHDSAGPHFGNVRTWLSPDLDAALAQDLTVLPLCSATVKELYGEDEQRDGWSVSVKISEAGSSSDWFWYETYDLNVIAGGTDVDLCVDCHAAGVDYVRTPYPRK